MKKIPALVLTAAMFILAMGNSVFAGELKVGAGQAPTQNILKPVQGPFEKATGIQLVIMTGSPKSALLLLEQGNVEAALGGLRFEDWLKYMKQEGEEVQDPSGLRHMIIGEDKIKVLIHKDNPVSRLTKIQLKKIFTGKITNWKEVGGKDIPITVVWTKLFGGNFLFTKNILDGESLRHDISEAEDSPIAKARVISNPGAIAIVPLGMVDSTVKSPKTPEVTRPITLITKGKPSPNVRKLIDFIRGEGRKHIKR